MTTYPLTTPLAERTAAEERALVLEHVARPVGRHGRQLLDEIERYLAFFAIARAA
jgi:hypothetical protein